MIAGTARGFRDILPKEALARERISATVRDCFAEHGYLPVETPLLEDRAALERGGRIKNTPFQLFDADGNLLMLRPDLTLPVARLVAGHVRAEELPARFRYNAPVVREQQSLRGQPRQFTQLGVELVGTDGAAAEVEVVRLLAEALATLEVPAWRLVFGSVTPLTALLSNCSPSPEFSAQVLALVHDSDLVSLDELVDATPALKPSAARALHAVPRMHGSVEVVDAIDELLAEADVPPAERGCAELKALVAELSGLFDDGRASFDFSIINSFDYYTGIIFKGYAEGIAASLASGGRYDAVLANLGRPGLAACGFALSLERLQEVLGEQGESGVVTPGVRVASRPLRIAVPKGSLFKDSLRVLEAAGLPVDELRDPGRKLIVRADDVEYIIVRAQDAPAFVGAGGADCGICGWDSLIEADLNLLQLVDLGYGLCTFIEAEPAWRAGQAERNYARRGSLRVATKYPRIASAWYAERGVNADIVSLHGNIELGPIVGMTDRIVDITATGATLRDNDLVITGRIMDCTARFFVNPGAARLDPRVRNLADRLAAAVKDKHFEPVAGSAQ